MAALKWDHLVHYVNDLDQPVQLFADHGLLAFRGGSHTAWGTYNALSYFGLTYLEFLGIENLELAQATKDNVVVRDAVAVLPEHEVLSRVVLRTDDIEAVEADLKAAGLSLSPIIDGRRLDNKGRLIEWRMMTIDGDFQGLVYPFIIQWNQRDEARLDSLNTAGINQPHPAGQVEMVSAVFRVTDPGAAAKHWSGLFGLPVTASEDGSFSLKAGGQTFDFLEGEENQFSQVIFKADSSALQGKTILIGEGEYVFK
ncbi:VOC family protein [Paenibacillus sp. MMS20-IR301]|uniref:VOC family protein n=1 Tax=Paenibacillus sp. MMS20-IR301 TaxID=2895946 RepID=UPI0028EB4B91|nr:VOC family protein [Paenibacillus sp. MMS20-IR301]WNS44713.1 VOC family protein [Paenibacillus sp. MMS20-IR301]